MSLARQGSLSGTPMRRHSVKRWVPTPVRRDEQHFRSDSMRSGIIRLAPERSVREGIAEIPPPARIRALVRIRGAGERRTQFQSSSLEGGPYW